MRQYNILFVHHGRVLGGAPVSLLNTIKGLEALGQKTNTILFAYEDMKPFFRKNCRAELGDISYPCLYFGRLLIGWTIISPRYMHFFLKDLLFFPVSVFIQYLKFRKEKPDLIHLNSSILLTTALAAKMANIKLVWHIREILIGKNAFIKKTYGWIIRKLADRVITISYAEAESLGKDQYNNVSVVFNFLDFKRFDYKRYSNSGQMKMKRGIDPEQKLAICISNISQRKGTLELVESVRYLNEKISIMIVGADIRDLTNDGASESNMSSLKKMLLKAGRIFAPTDDYKKKIARELENVDQDRIIFAGFQEDVEEYLSAADVILAPWTAPHFARPVFEAWAMKKAVIAFDIPGISENISHNVDGVLVPNKTGRGLAEAINDVIFDTERLNRMGEAGYKKADRFFRQEVNIQKIYQIYSELSGEYRAVH